LNCTEAIITPKEYLIMDLDLFACDETGIQCIFVQKFPLPRALMAVAALQLNRRECWQRFPSPTTLLLTILAA